MPQTVDGPALRPPASLRILAWLLTAVAVVLAAAAVIMYVSEVLIPGSCAAIAAVFVGYLVSPILAGRVVLGERELQSRADPAKTYRLPWREISAVETRRRLLTEIVAVRRGEQWLDLGAPRRWRFGADPAFAAAAADIAQRAGVALERGRSRLTVRRVLFRTVLAAAWVAVVVLLDPVWHSPLWPGRHEAARVPNACAVIGADAARLLGPGSPSRTPGGSTGMISDDDCSYGGAALSLRYELYRYAAGQDGGIEHAAREFRSYADSPWPGADPARPVPGLGGAATMIVSRYPRAPGNVSMIELYARRANVVVRLTYMPRVGKLGGKTVPVATAKARDIMATALSRIVVR
jgi:hypothetical protein